MENGVQDKPINKQRAYGLMLDIFGGAPYGHPIHEFRNLKNNWNPTSEQDFEDAINVIDRLHAEVDKAAQIDRFKDILNEVEIQNIIHVLAEMEHDINDQKAEFKRSQTIGEHHSIGDDLPPELL